MCNKFYAIYSPSNESKSSSDYSAQGFLTEDEAYDLQRQLIGSMSSVIEFDSKEQFIAYLEEIDKTEYHIACEALEQSIDEAGGWL